MKHPYYLQVFVLLLTLGIFTACGGGGEETAVVESGTYTGTIAKVAPEESEIYVNTDQGKLELYFIEKTTLTMDGDTVAFDSLAAGQKVEVTVEKVGKRLDPLKVRILKQNE